MRDIRRSYHSSKSRGDVVKKEKAVHNIVDKNISKKAEIFEKNNYQDIEYTKSGSPVMRAASHFDSKNHSSRPVSKEEFDILKRDSFFNNRKREFSEEDIKTFRHSKNKRRRIRKIFTFSLIFLVLFFIFAYTFLFDSAKVVVNPKWKDIEISDTFLIFKEDILIDNASSSLSKTVLKSAPKEVNQKAVGEITVYNNYSTSPQILIKNTRFQTKDGKIFRISDSVTVPGKSGTQPGSIKAKVSADSFGPAYNISPSEFTIPGFKGSPRYSGFYAKSTSSMTGGMSGTVQTVSSDDIAIANRDLKIDLNSTLLERAKDFSHEGYLSLYKNIIINYTDNQSVLISSDQNSYELVGTLNLISIKREILAKMLAKQILKDSYNELETVRLDEAENLTFTLDPDTDLDDSVIKVLITGKARLVFTYNEDNLKRSLAGENSSIFSEVIKNYKTSIVSATFSLKPFWSRSFSNNVKKISIEEELK
ncbi:MAG: hypothetical protein RI945_76 [Candidatus Parcubacteria bacterium]|jgi:hypothetical protein